MKNTEPKWRVEKESCREHVVTDGVSEFRCGQEEANWLCGVLNKWSADRGLCASCAHWRKLSEEDRAMFPFADRLSDQLGRRVDIGYCVASVERTGPTADGDWCESWELAMPDAR